uniref:DUF1740-domain-containing protein n=1 Tax=Steinernema glaseri TaxID=37863 RepID=A0A1I7Z277_9BILA
MSNFGGSGISPPAPNEGMTEEEHLKQMEEYNAYYAALQEPAKPKYSSLSLALAESQEPKVTKAHKKWDEKHAEDGSKKERKRERSRSSSPDSRRHHKRAKKDKKKKKHKKEKHRERSRSRSREKKPSTSGFLCNSEKWTFFKPSIHIDSRDFFIYWTRADRDNLYYGKFTRQEQAKYRLTVPKDILGGDYELRRVFGMTDASVPIESAKAKAKSRKAKIIYGPLLGEPEKLESFVDVNDVQTKGMVEETEPLEQQLQRLRVIRREQPRNKEVYKEIIDLEDKLAERRALFCSKKELEDVMKAHKDRMLELWKDYATSFSKDAGAVTGYLNLLVDKETSNAADLEKEITMFINTRKIFFRNNIEFWRFIVQKIYAKQSKSVLDYIRLIDSVIADFTSSQDHEEFLAELILLRTRLLFESGHVPSAVATLQVLTEITHFAPSVVADLPLESVRALFASFWDSGYPRVCDSYSQQIQSIFPGCKPGFASFLEEYKKAGGDVSELADDEAAARFVKGLKELIFQSTESLIRTLPKDSHEADFWLEMEAVRLRHLWSPLANYAEQKLKGVLESAAVPFKTVEAVVRPFKDSSIAKKLILDILMIFGVSTEETRTNEDNILKQFGVFLHPSMDSDLENFDEWLTSVLDVLSRTGKGSEGYRYALASTRLSKMTKTEQFEEFVKSHVEVVGADVAGCATVDQLLNEVDHPTEREELDVTYLKLTHLLQTIGSAPECFDQHKKPTSIYALRMYTRLVTVCPDNDQPYKKLGMSRQHLYRKVLGKQIVKEIEVACKQGAGFFAETSRILTEIFEGSLKIPSTHHALGEAATYIGFLLAAIAYIRTKSQPFEAFLEQLELLKLNYPQHVEVSLMDELTMQFLWRRSEVWKDRSLHSRVWRLNKAAVDRYPTNATLTKLLVNNGFVDGNCFALRCKFTCSDKDPFVNVIRACASIYFSMIRVKRQGSDFIQNVLERELTRGTLRKAIANFALCSHSSSFVRVWMRYERHFGEAKAVSMKNFASDALAIPFSKFLLTDYARMDRQLYDDVLKLIFNERGMLGFTHSAEAHALLEACRGTAPLTWTWPSPFARRFLSKKRVVEYKKGESG